MQGNKKGGFFMRHTFHKIRAVISALLVLGLVLSPSTTKAAETLTDAFPDPVWKTYSGSVDGVERALLVTKAENSTHVTPYIKIGDWEPEQISSMNDIIDSRLDKHAVVYILCDNKVVFWWSYDLSPNFDTIIYNTVPNSNDSEGYMHDIESFDVDTTGIITGFKTTSGTIYPVPSFDEMKEEAGFDSPIEPSFIIGTQPPEPEKPGLETPIPSTSTPSPMITSTPVASVSPTQTPSASTPTPTATVMPTEKPTQVPATPTPVPAVSVPPTQAPPALTLTPSTPTVVPETPSEPIISSEPNVEPTVTPVNKKLVIKNSKKKGVTTRSLCEGDKVVIEYSLKKGKLNWKAGKRKGTIKNVKYVVFIKKSRNLYVGDKKGRGYIISSKTGKKRLFIKKGAKKPTVSGRFGIRVRRAFGSPVSIINK